MALDWKWLFIYPDQGIAAVNQLVVPVGTPINFRLTSATVMNSFFVPQLGSQIYTMGGMTTHLNLLAAETGEYPGFSANFSGDGFAWMRFVAKAVPAGDFDAWVTTVRAAPARRSTMPPTPNWQSRAKPCRRRPIARSSPQLFEHIIEQTVSGPGKAGVGTAWCPPARRRRRLRCWAG